MNKKAPGSHSQVWGQLILAYLLFLRSGLTKKVLLVSMPLNWLEIFFV